MDWMNDGAIVPPGRGAAGVSPEASFIITGLARSGTSLLARVMQAGGMFIGETADEVVYEDVEIGAALEAGDRERLSALIASRQAAHGVWGFKRPHLHAVLCPADLSLFRNPRLVVSFRDPVAIAQRNVISEFLADWQAVEEAAAAQAALIGFLHATEAPMLLVSYEKAVTMPEPFVNRLIAFCGLPEMAARREAMIAAVEPNREAYRQGARRRYEGVIDQIAEGMLTGWAWQVDEAAFVRLVLCVDGERMTCFDADVWRPDLQAAGIGDGRHGFAVDVRAFLSHADSVVAVYVEGRTFILAHSGATMRQLAGLEDSVIV